MTNQSKSRRRNFEIKKRKEELYQYGCAELDRKQKIIKIAYHWDSWTEFKQWSFILNECDEAEAEAYEFAVEKHGLSKLPLPHTDITNTPEFLKTYSDGILEFCGKWDNLDNTDQEIIIKHWKADFEE